MQRGKLAVRKVIDFGVQITKGLAAAHDKGIVHRDLKPENLFVTKDGRVKILDFGLAKLTQHSSLAQHPSEAGSSGPTLTHQGTEPGMILGTVGYMSPEQVRGKAVDHRADIFAFGAILYEMLAGKRAFEKSTSAETMTAILNEDPSGVSQIAQSTPPGLQRVVHRCLEKNPEQRFQSASDLAFALEALSDSGISGPVVDVKKVRQNSWRQVLWVAGLATLVAAAVAFFVIMRRERASSLRISGLHPDHARRSWQVPRRIGWEQALFHGWGWPFADVYIRRPDRPGSSLVAQPNTVKCLAGCYAMLAPMIFSPSRWKRNRFVRALFDEANAKRTMLV
jgi:serine/threonine protein kinase